MTHDVAVIIVSTNDSHWLRPCLTSLEASGDGLSVQTIVVDNGPDDGTRELVEREFPEVTVVASENRGFSHANNVGLRAADARYLLILNPDTEFVSGELRAIVELMDARPEVGIAGVRQVDSSGDLLLTIRRFPSAARALGEALASERWPLHPSWSGERVLDSRVYEREIEIDWTPGSFMLARHLALESAGHFDERFFLYSDDPDLCLRVRRAGWTVLHLPLITIVHHDSKTRGSAANESQAAWARRVYARKHMAPVGERAYLLARIAHELLRTLVPGDHQRRETASASLRVLLGRAEPPYGRGPRVAIPSE